MRRSVRPCVASHGNYAMATSRARRAVHEPAHHGCCRTAVRSRRRGPARLVCAHARGVPHRCRRRVRDRGTGRPDLVYASLAMLAGPAAPAGPTRPCSSSPCSIRSRSRTSRRSRSGFPSSRTPPRRGSRSSSVPRSRRSRGSGPRRRRCVAPRSHARALRHRDDALRHRHHVRLRAADPQPSAELATSTKRSFGTMGRCVGR